MRSATWALGALLISLAAAAFWSAAAGAASPAQIEAAAEAPPDPGGQPALTKHFVEIQPGIYVAVTGSRERRLVRYARWIQLLDGDRLAVYEKEGYPRYRHYEQYAGRRTEHWTYRERGITYIFENGVLRGTKPF